MQELIKEFLAVVEEKGWKQIVVDNDGEPFTEVIIPQLPTPFIHDIDLLYYEQDGKYYVEMRFHGRGYYEKSNISDFSGNNVERALRGIIKMKDVLGEE